MIEDLPQTILNDILGCVTFKRDYQPLNENLQIKELLFCLRQSYLRRVQPRPITDLRVALKIYSGLLWDRKFCGLFPVNQKYVRYHCQQSPAKINGKYDFLDVDTVTELKLVDDVNVIDKPFWANQQQVRFYAFADNKEKAQVLYFDGKDAKKFPVDTNDFSGLVTQLESNARIFYDCLVYRQYPAKNCFSNGCGICEFQGVC